MQSKEEKVRRTIGAYKLTLGLYMEFKTCLGASRKSVDLGYSTDRIIRVCSADYIADVEKAVACVSKRITALERGFLKDSFAGKELDDTWLYNHASTEECAKVVNSAQLKAGLEFISCGLHPFILYSKPTDVR